MMNLLKAHTLLIALCAFPVVGLSQSAEEAWSLSLDSITVSGNRYGQTVQPRSDGSLRWNMSLMDYLPKILGNADPVHYAQMLPGIQTNNEFRSGLNMQGCDNAHNLMTLGGVPVYNVSHLLGFFSAFNPSHYPSFLLYKSLSPADPTNRLGGLFTMEPHRKLADSLSGELTVGLISSQATLRLPLTRRTTLTTSLRGSYLNLLYSRWLRPDGQQLRYSFYDVNATLLHQVDDANQLLADFYMGNDRVSFQENNYYADMNDTWGNLVGALHWYHQANSSLSMHHTLYVTSYHNRFSLQMQEAQFRLPSCITDVGYRGRAEWLRWGAAIETVIHHLQPQQLSTAGSFNLSPGAVPRVTAFEGSLCLDYRQPLGPVMALHGGLRGTLFRQQGANSQSLGPTLAFVFDDNRTQVSFSYALRHQYLFQTGFSNMGLPTEFWLTASEKRRPQYAHCLTLNAATYLFGRRYRLSADVFYRRLYHQIEYSGSVLDYLNTTYDIDRRLLCGDGYNSGFSLMLNKCAGPLTGWIAYSFTRARRSFPQLSSERHYPAIHERPHELDIVATYSLNRHWSFGATLVYASGTPFTAPSSISLINDNLLMTYGQHNGSRLKPYLRADLSATYKWQGRLLREQGINLSLYNALAHSNELFYYVRQSSDRSFAYHPVRFVIDILPSVSYFCKF